MAESFKNFYSSTTSNGDYDLIPFPDGNTRDLASLQEIHDLMITASSRKSSIDKDWKAKIDVYIKDSENKSYYLYNYLVLGDGESYHNEKTIVLRSNQSLCYSVNNINGGIVNTSASCIQENDTGGDVEYCTFKVIPTPSNANVLLESGSIKSSTGQITVPKGSFVSYTVTYTHYNTVTGINQINENTTIEVSLDELYCARINTNAENAVITLTSSVPGFEQEGDMIYVPTGTSVSWTVSAPHYITKSSSDSGEQPISIINENITKQVTLEYQNYTLTINPTPSDAEVKITSLNPISPTTLKAWKKWSGGFSGGTYYTTSESVPGSYTYSLSGLPTSNVIKTLSVDLMTIEGMDGVIFRHYSVNDRDNKNVYDVTYSKSITMPYNSSVDWAVSKEDYYTQSGTQVITSNKTLSINLELKSFVQPVLEDNGTMGGNAFACDQGTYYTHTDGRELKAYYVFNPSSRWQVNNIGHSGKLVHKTSKCWISWYNPNAVKITNLRIANSEGQYSVYKYRVYGSNDNSTWTQLVEGQNNNVEDNGQWDIDMSSNTSYFKYYKIHCYEERTSVSLQIRNVYITGTLA